MVSVVLASMLFLPFAVAAENASHSACGSTAISSHQISRRRRETTMCACRRRSASNCINDEIALDGSSEDAIKVMSYNLYGWNAFNQHDWRKEHVINKIKAWSPAVLGAQEVETGGGQGYHEVASQIVGETGLQEIGGSQFFDPSVLEAHESESGNLVGGYWISMTRFKHKKSQAYFLFFNSHWMHGHGREQAEIVADFVHEQRLKYDGVPSVLVGDSNQFCQGHDSDAWKYLLGQSGSSPVTFEDVHDHDHERSFSDQYNPDCRVDLMFASKEEWTLRQSDIDRDGMGHVGAASDHAPLMAELFPFSRV